MIQINEKEEKSYEITKWKESHDEVLWMGVDKSYLTLLASGKCHPRGEVKDGGYDLDWSVLHEEAMNPQGGRPKDGGTGESHGIPLAFWIQ